jgi:NADH dehydrogenase
MRRLAITGAGGFIGSVLTQQALERGYEVMALARRPPPAGRWIPWELGKPLPAECETADVLIHLASATLTAKGQLARALELDVSGTRLLAESAGPRRFIFLSSQSASAGARNMYGRSKFAIENLLEQDSEIIVKPGLVYDDAGGSVFGLLEKLSRLPVVPSLATLPNIQPIHVRDLAACILRIVETSAPQKTYCLGPSQPMTLSDAIKATAKRSGRRPPITIPMPLAPIRALAGAIDVCLRVSPPIVERIDGLTALRPMETAASLRALDFELEPL